VGAAPITALMMEAVRTTETLVHFNVTTRRYIPEDSKVHNPCYSLKVKILGQTPFLYGTIKILVSNFSLHVEI
jgi:hypothetical protein